MKKIQNDLKLLLTNLKAVNQKAEKIARQLAKMEKAKKKPKAKAKVKPKAKTKAKPKAKPKARPARAKAKTRPAKKAVAKKKAPAKKTRKGSASETVLSIIGRTKKGVNTAAIKKKTGFKDNNIRMIVYRLKKQGKIKSGGRGLYVKA